MSTNGRPAPIGGRLARIPDEHKPLDVAERVDQRRELLFGEHRALVHDHGPVVATARRPELGKVGAGLPVVTLLPDQKLRQRPAGTPPARSALPGAHGPCPWVPGAATPSRRDREASRASAAASSCPSRPGRSARRAASGRAARAPPAFSRRARSSSSRSSGSVGSASSIPASTSPRQSSSATCGFPFFRPSTSRRMIVRHSMSRSTW